MVGLHISGNTLAAFLIGFQMLGLRNLLCQIRRHGRLGCYLNRGLLILAITATLSDYLVYLRFVHFNVVRYHLLLPSLSHHVNFLLDFQADFIIILSLLLVFNVNYICTLGSDLSRAVLTLH